jgi:hypothetical protein
MDRIRTAGSPRKQVTAGAINELLDGPIGGSEVADEDALVILGPPFQHRGHECNAESFRPSSSRGSSGSNLCYSCFWADKSMRAELPERT